MIAGGADPTVHRRRLRSELRKTRELAKLTQRDVAREMDWSLSKLIRIETGAVSIATNDLRALLALYEITDRSRIDALIEVARASRERSWWSMYKDLVSQEYLAFLGYESSASVIRNFEPLLVPGLLQTEEYAREVLSVLHGPDPTSKIDKLVELRMQRQELLERKEPPSLHFILDEAVIRRIVGNPDVARRQLNHLRELASRPKVTIRVVSFSQGIYPGLRVPYVLFEFPLPEDEDILYIENPQGEMIIREGAPDGLEGTPPVIHLDIFWQLEQISPKGDTLPAIDDALARLDTTTSSSPVLLPPSAVMATAAEVAAPAG
jgi:transcriptional regulator with XRE-family HTH domain